MKHVYSRCLACLLPIITAALSACNFFTPPTQPIDLLAADPASTQIAALRATATFETDRMMVTMDAVNTAVRAVDVQSTRIAATLVQRGTPFVDISALTPMAPTSAALNNGNQNAAASINPSALPMVTPGGGAQGNVPLTPSIGTTISSDTTPTPLPNAGDSDFGQPTQSSGGAGPLSRIMLSRAVGSDDCATQSLTQFSTADTDIYVVATAQVSAGVNIRATFSHEGTEVVSYDWSPTFNVSGACIWFHMPSSAVAFTAGNWTVELTVNGTTAGSLDFTIQ